MRTDLTDNAIAEGTAGTVLQVRLEDWSEVQIVTGHASQCSPRPASPLPSRWDLPASAPADFAGLSRTASFGPGRTGSAGPG
ncbi:hypothetical protein OG883_44190 [Streptomyces sp. NBC_01142]|uniref:hypothetical protein n=1 Tax=Streptomyces sp. NBC_01142 TaxID=2975865 RepID=UPI00224DB957|nr:hypothetical protein [Streptomyces sp. NBC_01142]MCX4826644.1 hypothetical protein [Streptomyces sp. NBC_01142]